MDGFWDRVEKTDDCWEWQGTRTERGYGRVWAFGRLERAHRVAYVLEFGKIEDGLHVCHICDNPPCCNPDHLFLGTDKDNSDDKWIKQRGRAVTGEIHPSAKLTAAQVRAIRDEYGKGGVTQAQIAARYGVGRQQISKIITRTLWANEE